MKELNNIIRQFVRAKADNKKPIQAKGVEEWFISTHPKLWEEFSEQCAMEGLNTIIRKILNETRKWLEPGKLSDESQSVMQEIIDQVCPPQTIRVIGENGVSTYFAFEHATEEQITADVEYSKTQQQQYERRVGALEALLYKRRQLGVPPDQSLMDFLE